MIGEYLCRTQNDESEHVAGLAYYQPGQLADGVRHRHIIRLVVQVRPNFAQLAGATCKT